MPIDELIPTASLPTRSSEHSITLDVSSLESKQRFADATHMLEDLNTARRTAGLPSLVLDGRLMTLAVRHAADMIAHRFFGHDSSNGLTPFDRFDRAGLRYRAAGENIALDADEPRANRELERSNEHRQNILDPHFRRVGIAAMRADDGSEIFVQDFTD